MIDMWFCLARAITICGLLSSWAGLAAADYYIDNANASVTYTSPSTASWRTFSLHTSNLTFIVNPTKNVTLDSSKCYDENYVLIACTTGDDCQISIPFTGSGITMYILNAGFQGVGAGLSVDGGQAVTTTLPPPSAPSYQTPNVSLFSVQAIPYADHNATLSVMDWNGSASSLYFDYALVNQNNPQILPNQTSSIPPPPASSASTSSTSSSPTVPSSSNFVSTSTALLSTAPVGITYAPTSSPTSTSVPHTGTSINLDVIIGSACGGLAVIAALVSTLIFLKKRKSKFAKIEDVHPYPSAHNPTPPSPPPPPPPQMDEKTRLRLTYHNPSPSGGHTPADDDAESSDFQFLPSAASVRRVSTVRSLLNTLAPGIEPPLPDDLIFDIRRASSPLVGSGATTTGCPPTYQTVEDVTLDR